MRGAAMGTKHAAKAFNSGAAVPFSALGLGAGGGSTANEASYRGMTGAPPPGGGGQISPNALATASRRDRTSRLAAANAPLGDRYSGGAVPFAPLGTGGGGSTANVAAYSGMTGNLNDKYSLNPQRTIVSRPQPPAPPRGAASSSSSSSRPASRRAPQKNPGVSMGGGAPGVSMGGGGSRADFFAAAASSAPDRNDLDRTDDLSCMTESFRAAMESAEQDEQGGQAGQDA